MENAVRFSLAGAVVLLALAGCTRADKREMFVQDDWHGTPSPKKLASGNPGWRAPESRGRLVAINAGKPALWCATQRGSGLQADCTYDDFVICDMAVRVAGGTCKTRSRRNAVAIASKATHDTASDTGSACRSGDLPPVLRFRQGQIGC